MQRRAWCSTMAAAVRVGGVAVSHLRPAMAQVRGLATADVTKSHVENHWESHVWFKEPSMVPPGLVVRISNEL